MAEDVEVVRAEAVEVEDKMVGATGAMGVN